MFLVYSKQNASIGTEPNHLPSSPEVCGQSLASGPGRRARPQGLANAPGESLPVFGGTSAPRDSAPPGS